MQESLHRPCHQNTQNSHNIYHIPPHQFCKTNYLKENNNTNDTDRSVDSYCRRAFYRVPVSDSPGGQDVSIAENQSTYWRVVYFERKKAWLLYSYIPTYRLVGLMVVIVTGRKILGSILRSDNVSGRQWMPKALSLSMYALCIHNTLPLLSDWLTDWQTTHSRIYW